MLDKPWGVRFNTSLSYERIKKGQIPQGCPEWLNPYQVDLWQQPGLVVWNNNEKRITCLSGREALGLFEKLTAQENWKSEGISITRFVHRFEYQAPPRRSRKKADQEAATIETPRAKSEPVNEEMVHLPPDAGTELIELLRINKQRITEMAEQEQKRSDRAIRDAYDVLFKFYRENEETKFDFKGRPFDWKSTEKSRWSCQHQSVDGHICLEKSLLFWHACVKRADIIEESGYYPELEKAVDWVEKELVHLANQPPKVEAHSRIRSDAQIESDHARLLLKAKESPYWIDPASLEPGRVSYQVVIELDANPTDYKTYESKCGGTHRYDEHYPTPSKLATTLGLDFDRFQFKQPAGENSEWYRIASLTTYFQEASASEQAQKTWDQSQILQQFKTGKISRAIYGYQEVETGFTVYLGACTNPDKPWEQPVSRKAHMETLAMREALCYALDVNDYRDYLGVSVKLISDEQILMIMHKVRARSKCIPAEIKQESRMWLAQHETLE